MHSLKPADMYSLSAVNKADPAFADDHPHAIHCKDDEGKWCYAAFYRWFGGGRGVYVDRYDGDWDDSWWFAGVSK